MYILFLETPANAETEFDNHYDYLELIKQEDY